MNMSETQIGNFTFSWWLLIPLAYCVWVFALLTFKRIGLRILKRLTAHTTNNIDDILVQSLELPLTLLIFISGGMVVKKMIPGIAELDMNNYIAMSFKAATIVATVLFVDRFFNSFLKECGGQFEILRASGGIVRALVRTVVICIGFLVLVDSFGVSITPILASLGVGSLAVALALQPTLESLFAGIEIIVDKPILEGHFVRLESGEEGYVHRIGWRSTWIRLPPNNIVIIPNKSLVNARIINYCYPTRETAIPIEVGVHYRSDLEHVERVTKEVAREVLRSVPGGVAEFQPQVQFHTFAAFSINFSAVLRAKEYTDSGAIKHEFIKKLHQRYAKEGIIIPYPIQAVNHDQERVLEFDSKNSS